METIEVLQFLLEAPMTIILIYLLIREQKAHTETRAARDADNRLWMERYAGLAERTAQAVERLDLPGPL